eukprot:4434903-Pyramimonas_sp.AAC.1
MEERLAGVTPRPTARARSRAFARGSVQGLIESTEGPSQIPRYRSSETIFMADQWGTVLVSLPRASDARAGLKEADRGAIWHF